MTKVVSPNPERHKGDDDMTNKELTIAKKMGVAQVIDGEVIKVGHEVVTYGWLAFEFVIVGMPRANKIVLMDKKVYEMARSGVRVPDGVQTFEATRCHNNHKAWNVKMFGKVKIDFHPKAGDAESHNDAVESSERWMCM